MTKENAYCPPLMSTDTLSCTFSVTFKVSCPLFMSTVTLLSTIYPTFKFFAIAIRTSSVVRVSSLFNASSISLLPSSFLTIFSKKVSQEQYIDRDQRQLTRSSEINLLRGNCEYRKYFDHYLHKYVREGIRW